jgi:transcriptional regulator with XRE-family HTH domain
MPRAKEKLTLGRTLLRRRKQLGLTQAQVAARVVVRPNYVGYLEADARRPSPKVVIKLAKVLDLDPQELFFLANPQVRAVVEPRPPARGSTWERFKKDKRLQTRHGVTRAELRALERVSALGPVHSERDFLFILQAIRQALTDE